MGASVADDDEGFDRYSERVGELLDQIWSEVSATLIDEFPNMAHSMPVAWATVVWIGSPFDVTGFPLVADPAGQLRPTTVGLLVEGLEHLRSENDEDPDG